MKSEAVQSSIAKFLRCAEGSDVASFEGDETDDLEAANNVRAQ